MTDSTLTASDVALLGNHNSDSWGGNSFMWIFALLILAGGGFGGWGGNNREAPATHADVDSSMQFSALREGQTSNAAEIQRGIYEINAATKDAAYNNLGEIRDIQSAVAVGNANIINNLNTLQSNMQTCCCQTQRAIDGVNYNLASQSAAIQATDTANTQKILDAIATNRMADMQNQINQLQLQNAVSGVVRYPSASTYYAGNNPFCSGCGSIG